MTKNNLLRLLATALLLLLSSYANAAMYKWVDDAGNTHYSQTPPMDRQADQIAKPKAPPEPPKSATTEEATGTETPGGAPQEAQEPTEEEIQAEKRRTAQQCQRARQWISEIQNKPRVRVRDDSGNYRYLSEEERQARLRQAQDYLEKYCD